jgi:hypothetical protein
VVNREILLEGLIFCELAFLLSSLATDSVPFFRTCYSREACKKKMKCIEDIEEAYKIRRRLIDTVDEIYVS